MSTKERQALGKGFGALLKTVETTGPSDTKTQIAQISIDDIDINPRQPRLEFNPERLEELAQSIRIKGVIQPILIRQSESQGKKYELVAGERRMRASLLAGYDKIPAIIRPIKDQELLEVALIENIQRDNLNPIEESLAYKDLLEEHGYTQEDLAKRVGKNRSTIANMIRLLQLPEEIKRNIAEQTLSVGHGRSLLSVEDPKKQLLLKKEIIDNQYSVRETEELVRNDGGKKLKLKPNKAKALSNQMKINQDRLAEIFSTKVKISENGDKGKIELTYCNQDDFNRLFDGLVRFINKPN